MSSDVRDGNGWQGMEEPGEGRQMHQATVLSTFIDLLNSGDENAATALAARVAADGSLHPLLTIARLLAVQPDRDVIERGSALLQPWEHMAASGAAECPRGEGSEADVPVPAEGCGAASAAPAAPASASTEAPPAADTPALPADSPTTPLAPRGMLEVTGLDHVALPVSDLDRALGFYTGVLGLRVVNETRTPPPPITPHIALAAGHVRVLVYQALGMGEPTPRKALGGPRQFPYLALRVTETTSVLERLRASGCRFDGPSPSGRGHAAVHVWDPDGNQIDLIVPWPDGALP